MASELKHLFKTVVLSLSKYVSKLSALRQAQGYGDSSI
jgi:hypothetical protein